MFSGVFLVMVKADTAEELADYTSRIKQAGRKHVIEFEETYYHQEEALNSLLPIGKTYIDVKRRFMRDMTTTNIANADSFYQYRPPISQPSSELLRSESNFQ
ncbi:Type IV secretory pathway, VirB4 components [Streptococcus anginosus]|uniref:Type IV secretory pathway, VirB4 components n=1 Tax=Streptococcus anginosus TaxID=1328 RepID=A0A3S4QQ11_STRAP|nr:Type IV secretory pathway, VirB4 components [Streptococcus anginosus]